MSYQSTVLALSPTSYWKLDEASGTFADQTGGITGTASGTILYGQPSLVANDSGKSVYVELGNGIDFGNVYDFTGTAAFTAIVWGKMMWYSSGAGSVVWGNTEGWFPGWSYSIQNNGNNLLQFFARRANATADDIATFYDNNTLTYSRLLNQTHLYGIIYDGTNLYSVFDGVFSSPTVSSRSQTASTTYPNLLLGRWGGGGSYFTGYLDEPAIWSRALTANEFMTIYLAGVTFTEDGRSSIGPAGYGAC